MGNYVRRLSIGLDIYLECTCSCNNLKLELEIIHIMGHDYPGIIIRTVEHKIECMISANRNHHTKICGHAFSRQINDLLLLCTECTLSNMLFQAIMAVEVYMSSSN